MNHRLHFAGPRVAKDRLHGDRMVVDRRLVERPGIGRQVDAGAPIFQPDVVALVYQEVHQRGAHAVRAKDVRPHAGAMHQQDGSFRGRPFTTHIDEIALEAVARRERHHALRQHACFSLPMARR